MTRVIVTIHNVDRNELARQIVALSQAQAFLALLDTPKAAKWVERIEGLLNMLAVREETNDE